MKHATNCKFCKRPMTLLVDDEYEKLGDPLKIITLACCDRCADLRIRRRIITEQIQAAIQPLFLPSSKLADVRAKARTLLTTLTQKYTRLVADWLGATSPAWDAEMVEVILDRPDQTSAALRMCWRLYEPKEQQRHLVNTGD